MKRIICLLFVLTLIKFQSLGNIVIKGTYSDCTAAFGTIQIKCRKSDNTCVTIYTREAGYEVEAHAIRGRENSHFLCSDFKVEENDDSTTATFFNVEQIK